MGRYSYLTDDALIAEITEYRSAVKGAALGGAVTDISGEGRRMVVSPVNLREVRSELRELEAELARRGLGGCSGGAIAVEIG